MSQANEHDTSSPRLKLVRLRDFLVCPKGTNQIRNIDPGKAIVVVFGAPKGGKTFSIADLTMHAAHGLDWHGFRIRKPLRVAYLVGEGVNGFKVRLKAWLEAHDGLEETGDFQVFALPVSLPACIEDVLEMLQAFQADIVVIDTLNAYFGAGNENDTQDMTVFCNAIRRLRDELGTSVYVIHHSGVNDSGRERGSIVLRASADVLIQVAKDEGGTGLVGFQVITGRDIEAMSEPLSLRLLRVETDWRDEDGLPFATCVITAGDMPVTLPGRGTRPLGRAQAAVLKAAQDLVRSKPASPSGGIILDRTEVSKAAQAAGIGKSSVSSAWEPLQSRGYLRLVEPGGVIVRMSRP